MRDNSDVCRSGTLDGEIVGSWYIGDFFVPDIGGDRSRFLARKKKIKGSSDEQSVFRVVDYSL